MPTKHKRKRGHDDKSQYDLPPTSRARSLPVIAPTKNFLTPRISSSSSSHPSKRRRTNEDKTTSATSIVKDDTPKNFARLMAWHMQGKKLAPGLDDGTSAASKVAKKRKVKPRNSDHTTNPTKPTNKSSTSQHEDNSPASTAIVSSTAQIPTSDSNADTSTAMAAEAAAGPKPLKILPSETLAEFNFRVDQTLPLKPSTSSATTTGNTHTNIPSDLRIRSRLTKHNKRLERMQAEWRATEAKLREKEEEQDEEDAEKRDEENLLWEDVRSTRTGGKKKGKRRHGDGDEEEGDPWRQLLKKRGKETRQKNVRDVVLEPPVLRGVKNMFKEKRERRSVAVLGGGSRQGGMVRV